MRYLFAPLLLSMLACHTSQAQDNPGHSSDETAVLKVVSDFLAAGDVQDASLLEPVLHSSFRILINQFMGSPDVAIFDRATYIGMIADKKFGGDPRSSATKSVEIVGNLAFVRAAVQNSSLQFDTLYTLVQDSNGKWWLAAEAPYVQAL